MQILSLCMNTVTCEQLRVKSNFNRLIKILVIEGQNMTYHRGIAICFLYWTAFVQLCSD